MERTETCEKCGGKLYYYTEGCTDCRTKAILGIYYKNKEDGGSNLDLFEALQKENLFKKK